MNAAATRGERPVALVTGAAGGLGGAIATALAGRGWDLVLADIDESPALLDLCEALRRTGVAATPVAQDLTRVEALPGFVARVHAIHGRLDGLINNAGVSVLSRGDILDVTPESFDRCVAVNLRAQFFLTQAVAKRMIADRAGEGQEAKRRVIVTVTTVAVESVVATVLAEYATSKAGLSHALKHFAVRLATEGIDCHEVRPGMMRTAMTATSRDKYDALIASGFVPARRWGELSEIGETIADLAGGALRYVVGQTINLDGGMALKAF